MPTPELSGASLTEVAYSTLKQRIVDCELEPGRWLTERQLAAQLMMGISPVRGALARLDHDGLVTTTPRRGYRVTPLTIKRVNDVFTAWGIVGPAIARMAAEQMTDQQARKLNTLTPRARGRSVATLKKSLDSARAYFALLARYADNPILTETFERLDNDQRRCFIYVHSLDPTVADLMEKHGLRAEWADAFRRHDGDAAAALVREFVAAIHHMFITTLSGSPAVLATQLVQTGTE